MMAERFSRLVRDHLDTAIRARGKLGDEVIDQRIDISGRARRGGIAIGNTFKR